MTSSTSGWRQVSAVLPTGIHRVIIEGEHKLISGQLFQPKVDEITITECSFIEGKINCFPTYHDYWHTFVNKKLNQIRNQSGYPNQSLLFIFVYTYIVERQLCPITYASACKLG